MNDPKFIRDAILKGLKDNQDFGGMVFAEIDGCYFSAADIALPDCDNTAKVFRIVIVKHS